MAAATALSDASAGMIEIPVIPACTGSCAGHGGFEELMPYHSKR